MYQITTFKSQNKERILECIYRNPDYHTIVWNPWNHDCK